MARPDVRSTCHETDDKSWGKIIKQDLVMGESKMDYVDKSVTSSSASPPKN